MPQMPSLIRLFLFFSTIVSCSRAYSFEDNPDCAQPCLREGAQLSACPSTNTKCLCHDVLFMNYMGTCSAERCSPSKALATRNTTWTVCQLQPHRVPRLTPEARIVSFVLCPTLAVGLRIMSKFWRACRWGMDDAFIIAAFVVLISFVPLSILVEKLDTKTVFWNSTPAQVAGYFVVFYVLQALYVTCITLIKASILFMYLRIFPDERFRAVLWATQAFNLAVGLTFTLVGLFQCRPVHLGWTWWRQPELREGHCLNVIAETIVHTAIQLMLDVWMLALTATQVLGMNMPLREKLAIMLMFGLGLFLTAVSAVRLKVVVNAPNSTGDSSAIPVWSDVELYVGVVTACVPSIRQLFRKILFTQRGLFKTTSPGSDRSRENNSGSSKSPAVNSQCSGDAELARTCASHGSAGGD